jgi:hypothetical protein
MDENFGRINPVVYKVHLKNKIKLNMYSVWHDYMIIIIIIIILLVTSFGP